MKEVTYWMLWASVVLDTIGHIVGVYNVCPV